MLIMIETGFYSFSGTMKQSNEPSVESERLYCMPGNGLPLATIIPQVSSLRMTQTGVYTYIGNAWDPSEISLKIFVPHSSFIKGGYVDVFLIEDIFSIIQ